MAVAAPVIATANRFTDVPDSHQFSEAINWTRQEGLFRGYPGNEFRPQEPLSDSQLGKVLRRLLEDRYDGLNRGEAAAFLYYGVTGLEQAAADRPPTPETLAQTACRWPLGDPYWVSKPDTFRFPVSNNCEQIIEIILNQGDQSSEKFVVATDATETETIQWRDTWPDMLNVQVTMTDTDFKETRKYVARDFRDKAPPSTKPAPTTTIATTTTTQPVYDFPWDTEWVSAAGGETTFNLLLTNNTDRTLTFRVVLLGSDVGTPHTIRAGETGKIRKSMGSQYSRVKLDVYLGDLKVIDAWITRPTAPTTTTTTIPPFPIQDRLDNLDGKIRDSRVLFGRAVKFGHRRTEMNLTKDTVDDAIAYGEQLLADYQAHEGGTDPIELERLNNTISEAEKWEADIHLLHSWQNDPQPADHPLKQPQPRLWTGNNIEALPKDLQTKIGTLNGVWHNAGDMSDATKRSLYRFVYYHALDVVEWLDRLILTGGSPEIRGHAKAVLTLFQSSYFADSGPRSSPFAWLMTNHGFIKRTSSSVWAR